MVKGVKGKLYEGSLGLFRAEGAEGRPRGGCSYSQGEEGQQLSAAV